MSEPLPCPFCGQVPERMGNGVIDTACEAGCILYGHCYTEKDWNRRTPPPATAKLRNQLSSYRKAPLFDGCTCVTMYADGETGAAFLAEWPDPES